MRKHIEAIHCDRCGKEIKLEAPLAEGTKEIPDYFRLIKVTNPDGSIETSDKTLTHLCDSCKTKVKTLDERIFTDAPVRRTNGENEEKGATSDA